MSARDGEAKKKGNASAASPFEAKETGARRTL